MTKALLLSNSTCNGRGFLDHAIHRIDSFLGPDIRRILFLPYARAEKNWDVYTTEVRERLAEISLDVVGIHTLDRPVLQLADFEAILIGGGNTYRLLDNLKTTSMLGSIQRRIRQGCRYIGSSAGTNVACPTICTSNDNPARWPSDPNAMGLVPFQVKPHYLDDSAFKGWMGDTHSQRIIEYLEENDTPVIGLREGSWLEVRDMNVFLGGPHDARVFIQGREPEECSPGQLISDFIGYRLVRQHVASVRETCGKA